MGNAKSNEQRTGETGVEPSPAVEPGNDESLRENEGETETKAGEGSSKDYKLECIAEAQYDPCGLKKCPGFHGLVTVEAPLYEKHDRPGIDCVCVLDVSGSMMGQKISLVRKSMRRLVRNLGSKDRVCFVTFDTNVKTVMEFTIMNEDGKERARNLVAKLKSGTSTNLCGGLVTGLEKIKSNLKNEVAAVLLFTDGQANVGEQTPEGILAAASKVMGKVEDPTHWKPAHVQKWLTQVGLQQYSSVFEANSVDGMMLLTDLTDEVLLTELNIKKLHMGKFKRELSKLRQMQEGEGTRGATPTPIVVNTFGFGSDHNNTLLEKIASKFDGMYFYMEDEKAIVAGFANCLGGMLSTVAQNIELTISPSSEVSDFVVHKDENVTKNADGTSTIHFGDIQSEEKRHVLVSMTLPEISDANPAFEMFGCCVTYRNLVSEIDSKETITGVVNRSGEKGEVNVNVDKSINRVRAAKAMAEAEALGERNQLAQARKVITEAKALIQESPSTQDRFCINLVTDLDVTLNGLKSVQEFNAFGKGYMVQNAMCLSSERAANYSPAYATQSCYTTMERESAYDSFQRSDSMDSDAFGSDDHNDFAYTSPVPIQAAKIRPNFGNNNNTLNIGTFDRLIGSAPQSSPQLPQSTNYVNLAKVGFDVPSWPSISPPRFGLNDVDQYPLLNTNVHVQVDRDQDRSVSPQFESDSEDSLDLAALPNTIGLKFKQKST